MQARPDPPSQVLVVLSLAFTASNPARHTAHQALSVCHCQMLCSECKEGKGHGDRTDWRSALSVPTAVMATNFSVSPRTPAEGRPGIRKAHTGTHPVRPGGSAAPRGLWPLGSHGSRSAGLPAGGATPV